MLACHSHLTAPVLCTFEIDLQTERMKLLLVSAALVLCVMAEKHAPVYPAHPRPAYGYEKPPVKILSSKDSRLSDQTYNFAFASEDGIERSENGAPLPDSHYEEGGYSQHGGVKYISPEGQTIELKYKADGEGFVPVGDHLPTPVPNPYDRSLPVHENAYN